MPVAKNPYMRYKIINACLINKRKPYPTLAEIKDALAHKDFDVTTRAIEKDLEAMRQDSQLGYFAPIVFCRKNKGYHYSDPNFSIETRPWSPQEAHAFEVAVESLKRFKGAQVLRHLEGIFDKLDKVVMQQLKTKKAAIPYPVVQFERVPFSKGIEHFDKLYDSIINRQPLLVEYKKFGQPVRDHIVHPYLLTEYKFRWYVVGYSERSNSMRTMALDRIERLINKKVPYKPCKPGDIQKYFEHTIGVTINADPVQEIKLWFSAAQAYYLKTQHLHATQKIVSDDDTGIIISLKLIPNYELLQTLLAFGPEVKVLEPLSLRDQMIELVTKTIRLYQLPPGQ